MNIPFRIPLLIVLFITRTQFLDTRKFKVTNTVPTYSKTLYLTKNCFLGAPKVSEEKTADEINGGHWITVTIKSIPEPFHVQWSAKRTNEDTFTPVDINDEEHEGTTVSLPHPVLFVRHKDILENKCFRIEVTNFIGRTELEISGKKHVLYFFLFKKRSNITM